VEVRDEEPRAGILAELWEVAAVENLAPLTLPTTRESGPQPAKDSLKLDYLADSPEFLAYTIADIGYRDKIDTAFLNAIRRARRSL
jgi:hypothetical protein